MADGAVVVVGGTAGIGREIAQRYADSGREVVISGRDQGRAESVAAEIGGRAPRLALDPIRVNALRPGIVGDSPFWAGKDLSAVVARTPTGRLATMAEVTDAAAFLLENRSVNGVNLTVDGGWIML